MNENFASETLYKETLPENPQVCAGKTRRFRWGKTVSDVTSRKDLSFSAKVLFDAFSQLGRGCEIVALSQVALSDAIGSDRGTVQLALDSLERAGLIAKHDDPGGHSQIQAYRMLHPSLVRREKGQAEMSVQRKVALVKCLKCKKRWCPPNKTGWCLGCRKRVETDAHIDRRISMALVGMAVSNGGS